MVTIYIENALKNLWYMIDKLISIRAGEVEIDLKSNKLLLTNAKSSTRIIIFVYYFIEGVLILLQIRPKND